MITQESRMTQKQSGFTLIEILMTIGVVGILFASAIALFFRVYRGSGKSGSIVDVEKNAQLTLGIIDRFVKNAQKVTSACPGVGSSLVLLNRDGQETTFTLITDADDVSRVASNSAPISAPEVDVTELTFTCRQPQGAPEQIDISMTVDFSSTSEDVNTVRTYTSTSGLRNY